MRIKHLSYMLLLAQQVPTTTAVFCVAIALLSCYADPPLQYCRHQRKKQLRMCLSSLHTRAASQLPPARLKYHRRRECRKRGALTGCRVNMLPTTGTVVRRTRCGQYDCCTELNRHLPLLLLACTVTAGLLLCAASAGSAYCSGPLSHPHPSYCIIYCCSTQ